MALLLLARGNSATLVEMCPVVVAERKDSVGTLNHGISDAVDSCSRRNFTLKALTREASSLASPVTISTPCHEMSQCSGQINVCVTFQHTLADSLFAASLLGLRVTPRIFHLLFFRRTWQTDPPWVPVAPSTQIVDDIIE